MTHFIHRDHSFHFPHSWQSVPGLPPRTLSLWGFSTPLRALPGGGWGLGLLLRAPPPTPASNTFLPSTGLLASWVYETLSEPLLTWHHLSKSLAHAETQGLETEKVIDCFVFCHCALSSLLSKGIKATVVADCMNKDHWVPRQNKTNTQRAVGVHASK